MPRWNGPQERLARLCFTPLAYDTAAVQIPFMKMKQLRFADAERPYIAVWSSDNALHQSELAVERNSLGRRHRFAILVEHRDRLAAIGTEPGIIVGIHCQAEGATLHATTSKSSGDRGNWFPVRVKLGRVALPKAVL